MKATTLDTARFARDLSGLLALGYTLEEAVEKTGESQNDHFRGMTDGVVESLRKGQTLAQALKPHEDAFPLFYRFVESAESGETLVEGLNRSAFVLEEIADRRQRTFLTVLYPTLVLTFGAVGLWLTIILLGGMLTQFFQSMGVALPLPTRLFLSVHELLQNPLISVLYFAPLFLLWLMVLGKTPLSAGLYRIPLLGSWLLRQESVLYLSTVGHLSTLGMTLPEAARTALLVCPSHVQQQLKVIPEKLVSGDTFSQALRPTSIVPELGLWALERGEQSGDLHLDQVSHLIERELTLVRATGLVLFEPVIFLAMGIFIGAFVISVFLPLYQLIGNLG